MNEVVWDSSVLLAVLLDEPSIDLEKMLGSAVLSCVSIAEVRSKLSDLGRQDLERREEELRALIRVADFTLTQALIAGALRMSTRSHGLSLGDRACLALALELGAEVYTADAQWARVEVGCKVHLIR